MKRPSKLTWPLAVAVVACLGLTVPACTSNAPESNHPSSAAQDNHGNRPTCSAKAGGPPKPVTPTTVGTIEQAYYCLLDHYVYGGKLDDRVLLNSAFAGLAQELGLRGLEQADATAPALSGDRDKDWSAFSVVYTRVTDALPNDPAVRQAVAAATMNGMVGSLHDNHVGWSHPEFPPNFKRGEAYGLGLSTSPWSALIEAAPREAVPPLFITKVDGGPAAEQGLQPGDIIESVNGAPIFADGIPSKGALNLLFQPPARSEEIKVTLHRPATDHTWTVTMKPTQYKPASEPTHVVTSNLLADNIADVRLAGFAPNAADQVLKAIADLSTGRTLRGVILDLRGNGGGSPTEVARLLGALVHGKVSSYECDAADKCTENHPDDTVPLLNLPVVVLIDRNCVSACDSFSSTVKDLKLGTLIGTRTGGVVSGPAEGYLLSDNSQLKMPSQHEKGANGEIINGIGVAPDIYLPQTAHDLSTGKDPAVDKALTSFGH